VALRVAVQGWLLATGPSGANRRLSSLLEAMREHKDRVEVIPLVDVGIPAEPTWKRVTAERKLLPRIVRESGAQVLSMATLPAPPDCEVPLCLTIHDLRDLGEFARGRLRRIVARRILADAVSRAAAITVPSSFTAEEVLARHPEAESKLWITPNGVGDEFLEARPRKDGNYLLHVGSLERRKNIPMLLAAMQIAEEAPPLWLVGAWRAQDERVIAHEIERLGLSQRVRLVGRVPDAELPGLYAGAALTLVPSLYEGFGLPVIEAQATGCPVLVSDRGALPEVAKEGGLVLPADDPSAWAREITKLLRDDAERAERARKGTEHARHRTWRRVARLELATWEEVHLKRRPE
jgi:glycosyltransferase involved in cell wall biosynthesis